MLGTIRAFDTATREDIYQRIKQTAERIAESAGATAEVVIRIGIPPTINDPALTQRMIPVLQRVFGQEAIFTAPPQTVAEDFSCYQQVIPGMYYYLGITPANTDYTQAAPNHSPHFFVDESALVVGVRSLSHLVLAQLTSK